MAHYNIFILCFIVTVLSGAVIASFFEGDSSDRVSLRDISVLTLYNGRMTNARRSSPIPQLKCVGGTAGCGTFVPQVVQCYNRGSDGHDTQWECKTDMDNEYRFGQVEVSCEGYDYPEDPSVLKGSCGLEYTLDLTKEGHQNKKRQHEYYGENHQQTYDKTSSYPSKKSSGWGDLIMLGVVGLIIYAIYQTCLTNNHTAGEASGRRPAGSGPPPSGPPPPGFRDEYMPPGGGCSSTFGNTYTSGQGYAQPRTHNTGGGFWGGAATGGLLGYMFGSRNNQNYYQRPRNQGWGSGWGSGFGSSTTTTTSRPSAPSSSGTRTASGFGGTKRR